MYFFICLMAAQLLTRYDRNFQIITGIKMIIRALCAWYPSGRSLHTTGARPDWQETELPAGVLDSYWNCIAVHIL